MEGCSTKLYLEPTNANPRVVLFRDGDYVELFEVRVNIVCFENYWRNEISQLTSFVIKEIQLVERERARFSRGERTVWLLRWKRLVLDCSSNSRKKRL